MGDRKNKTDGIAYWESKRDRVLPNTSSFSCQSERELFSRSLRDISELSFADANVLFKNHHVT